MSWFSRYIHKWSWDNFDDIIRDSIPEPNWMERLPNGKFYWQVSLDKAMQRGREEFGPEWEGSPYSQHTGIEADRFGNKRAVFFDWLERVPPKIVHYLKNMIDNHLENTEGFRPFGTENTTDNSMPTPSIDELEGLLGQ